MTRDDLIAFEADIAAEFNAAHIHAPVHLAGGNENHLIEVFKKIKRHDWIACTWRSHYHCLLKGVPPEQLKADIMAGKSITLCYPKYRIVSSAIVGGNLPIALGIAWSIKRAGNPGTVWAFAGDMAAMGGMFHECIRYACGHDLPIRFVVEDNGKSVGTDTKDAWGRTTSLKGVLYAYELNWPHSGAGTRVNF